MTKIGRYWSTLTGSTTEHFCQGTFAQVLRGPDVASRHSISGVSQTRPEPDPARRRRRVVAARRRRRRGSADGVRACAYWLADAGWDVVVVEKKTLPRG